MLSVRQLLSGKNIDTVYSVRSDQTVIEALELMAAKNIGAVMVIDDDRLVGIFSERDYARKGIIQGRKAKSTPISEVMTSGVYTIEPTQTLEDCMATMSSKHIRHLPVVDDAGSVTGLISIKDLVKTVVGEKEKTIKVLSDFALGKGGHFGSE